MKPRINPICYEPSREAEVAINCATLKFIQWDMEDDILSRTYGASIIMRQVVATILDETS